MVEVISHLQNIPGSKEIDLTLEIDARIDNGIDQKTATTILENSRDMKVDNPEIFNIFISTNLFLAKIYFIWQYK